MSSKRSIYLRMPMTRAQAESRLAELYENAELITKALIDPSQAAQSMSISAGGGSKSMTFRTVDERKKALAENQIAIEDLEARLNDTGIPGAVIKHIEVVRT